MKIENLKIYGIEQSFRASKFPMAADIDNLDGYRTQTIEKLAHSTSGSGHDNFLNGIIAQFDLTFSNKAWVELQRYHFIDFVSSQSTMHRISRMDIRQMCNEYVDDGILKILEKLKRAYLETMNEKDYLRLLYNIPSGFQLTARMTTNYRQLKTIYQQRKNHRLPEWREFCGWIETLPQSDLIISAWGENNDAN